LAEASDKFGEALAVGDLNGDGRADVAVGTPSEDIGVGQGGSAGGVTVLYGAATGFSATGAQSWSQDSPGVPTRARSAEGFGYSVRIAPLRAGEIASLFVGAIVQIIYDPPGIGRGVVHVLKGTPTGVTGSGSRLLKSPVVIDGWQGMFGFCLA
jgi:hypothetical protein